MALAVLDLASRRDQILAWPRATLAAYAGTLAISVTLWGALVAAASARRAWGSRALLVLTAALAVGAQRYFFARYHAYMNPRAVLVGTSMLPSVGQQLWVDRFGFFVALAPPMALAVLLPLVLERVAPIGRAGSRMALDIATLALLAAAFASVPPGAANRRERPTCSTSLRWDAWRAHGGNTTTSSSEYTLDLAILCRSSDLLRGDRRSVLFVVTESVRATGAFWTWPTYPVGAGPGPDADRGRRPGEAPLLVRCHDEATPAREICARVLNTHEGRRAAGPGGAVRAAHHSDLLEIELNARKSLT